jgi:hypothetical protein
MLQEDYEKYYQKDIDVRKQEKELFKDKIHSIVTDVLHFTGLMQTSWLEFYLEEEGIYYPASKLRPFLEDNFKHITYGELKEKYRLHFYGKENGRYLWYVKNGILPEAKAQKISKLSTMGKHNRKIELENLLKEYYQKTP